MLLIDTLLGLVAVGLIGPIFPANVLSMIDYCREYPETITLKGMGTERIAEALFESFTRLCIHNNIPPGIGKQCTSKLMKNTGC
jgi:hypothetical protein